MNLTIERSPAPTDMPARKPKTYKLDERLIDAVEKLAESLGQSGGSYVEQVLWKHCQGMGVLPIAENPPKDQRGGKRSGAGRPKVKLDDESAIVPSADDDTTAIPNDEN
jgi:hypothetical protein